MNVTVLTHVYMTLVTKSKIETKNNYRFICTRTRDRNQCHSDTMTYFDVMTQFRDTVSSSLNYYLVLSWELSLLRILKILVECINKYTSYVIVSSLIRWNLNIFLFFAPHHDVFDVTYDVTGVTEQSHYGINSKRACI